MRYIIIPGLIILYLLWSYYSIKELIKNFNSYHIEAYALTWAFLHLVFTILFLTYFHLNIGNYERFSIFFV